MENMHNDLSRDAAREAGRSFPVLALRFTAFVFNVLTAVLFMLCIYAGGIILFASMQMILKGIETMWPFVVPALAVMSPVSAVLFMSYKTSGGRQTPGNKYMGFKVVDRNGAPLTFSKSLIRSLMWLVSALPCGLGLLWAALSPSGRGWHDMILDTRVVSVKDEDVSIPVLAFLSFILGLLSLMVALIPLLHVMGFMSSLPLMWRSMVILMILIPLAFTIGVIYRIIARIKKVNIPWGKQFAKYGIRIALITGIMFLGLAAVIPSSSSIFRIHREIECERDITRIAEAVEHFMREHKSLPDNLGELTDNGYMEALPTCRYEGDYIYRIETDYEARYFVIECPNPQAFLKGRGLFPAKECQVIKYVQGKGLVVRTK